MTGSSAFKRLVRPGRHSPLRVCVVMALLTAGLAGACGDDDAAAITEPGFRVQLTPPRHASETSVEEALLNRRSVRDYTGEALTLAEVSQLLWAAQGTTDSRGLRTAPSAGALYPLEVYLVVGDVTGLAPGVYRYVPGAHEIVHVLDQDHRALLADAAVGQNCVQEAAVDVVFTAVPERTTGKYGDRGIRYVHMEAGHAAQNVYLQAEALGLGMTVVGAFDDGRVLELVAASPEEEALYVLALGRAG